MSDLIYSLDLESSGLQPPYTLICASRDDALARLVAHWFTLGKALHAFIRLVSFGDDPYIAHGLGTYEASDCPVLVNTSTAARVPGVIDPPSLRAFLVRNHHVPEHVLVLVPPDSRSKPTAPRATTEAPAARAAPPPVRPAAPSSARASASTDPVPPNRPATTPPARARNRSRERPAPLAKPGSPGNRRSPGSRSRGSEAPPTQMSLFDRREPEIRREPGASNATPSKPPKARTRKSSPKRPTTKSPSKRKSRSKKK